MMHRGRLMRIILIAGSVLIIIGVALMTWMLATADERNVIKVSLDEDETKPIKFEALSLVPGSECEYVIKLKKGGSDEYDLKFDFVETGDGKLKEFARVKIITNGNVVHDELLATALDNDQIISSVNFDEDRNTEFRIVYYLPLDVGNEAKNAEALFGLMLTASNE